MCEIKGQVNILKFQIDAWALKELTTLPGARQNAVRHCKSYQEFYHCTPPPACACLRLDSPLLVWNRDGMQLATPWSNGSSCTWGRIPPLLSFQGVKPGKGSFKVQSGCHRCSRCEDCQGFMLAGSRPSGRTHLWIVLHSYNLLSSQIFCNEGPTSWAPPACVTLTDASITQPRTSEAQCM